MSISCFYNGSVTLENVDPHSQVPNEDRSRGLELADYLFTIGLFDESSERYSHVLQQMGRKIPDLSAEAQHRHPEPACAQALRGKVLGNSFNGWDFLHEDRHPAKLTEMVPWFGTRLSKYGSFGVAMKTDSEMWESVASPQELGDQEHTIVLCYFWRQWGIELRSLRLSMEGSRVEEWFTRIEYAEGLLSKDYLLTMSAMLMSEWQNAPISPDVRDRHLTGSTEARRKAFRLSHLA